MQVPTQAVDAENGVNGASDPAQRPRVAAWPGLAAALLAGALGYLLNRHGLGFFSNTEMVFGGCLSLAVAWCFGPVWGGLTAALAYSVFIDTGQFPWRLLFYTSEAAISGWYVRRRGVSGPASVAAFWCLGAPLAALVSLRGHSLPFPNNWAVALTYPANGLLNALLSTVLLALVPRRWSNSAYFPGSHRSKALTRLLFQRFAMLAALPMAAVALFAGRAFDQQVRLRAANELDTAAQDVAARLDGFLREHERAVITLGDQLAVRLPTDDPSKLDYQLFLLRRRYPTLISTLLADQRGAIIAASPERGLDSRPLARSGVSVADRDFFLRARSSRQSFVSGVFRSENSDNAWTIAVSAPVIRNGVIAGVIEASVNLERLCAAFADLPSVADRDLIVVDSVGNVVLSRSSDTHRPLAPSDWSSLQKAAEASHEPVFLQERRGHATATADLMLTCSARAGLSGWTVLLREPLWRSLQAVAGFYLATLVTCGAAVGGVLWLARSTASVINEPLRQLTCATRALAAGATAPPLVHNDAPEEIAQIARDVSTAASQLSERNRQLTATVADRDRLNLELNALLGDLDRKVQERTEALAARNAELKDLIAAQRKAQLAIAESDRRYRTVLEHLSDVVFQTDRQGRWTLLSPAWARITGRSPEDTLGQEFSESLHADDRDECLLQFGDLLRGEIPEWVRRARLKHEDGSHIWVHVSARLTRNSDSIVTGVAGTLSDVTELVENEEALRLSRRRFDLAVRGSGAGLWDWDLDTGMFYFSPRAKEMLGYTDTEFSNHGRDWVRALHAEDQPRVLRGLRRSVGGRNPVFDIEFRMRHRDGTWRWIDGRGAALRDEQGRTLRIAGSLTDITDRKRAQAALEERSAELSVANAQLARAARLKDEFLASMSHELRTPLNAVLGMAEVMLEEIPGPLVDPQRDCIQTIAESGRHLLALINDILDLSKIEAGKIVLDREPVLIRDIVNASLRFIKEAAQKKRLKLCEDYHQSADSVYADSRRLKQILINLLANAVKFTPEGGQVGIEVMQRPEHDAVAFTVWDSGIGIAAADLGNLFQAFVQVDSKLSRQFGGTGLGLAIVRKLADLHEGSISVESTPGEGSRFTVILPVGEVETSAAAPSPVDAAVEAPVAVPPGLRVLLIDDKERNIATFRHYLEAHGCTISLAATGPEGLSHARTAPPDVIVLDIQLPGMDGFEVLRQLAAVSATASVPVVAVTALNMPGDRERCLARGARAYLEKPVRLPTLLAALVQAAGRPAGKPAPAQTISV